MFAGLALPFPGSDCFPRGRHSGVCLLRWRGLHLETEEPPVSLTNRNLQGVFRGNEEEWKGSQKDRPKETPYAFKDPASQGVTAIRHLVFVQARLQETALPSGGRPRARSRLDGVRRSREQDDMVGRPLCIG